MAADQQTCTIIKDLLSSERADPKSPGRELLEGRLRGYLLWKKRLIESESATSRTSNLKSSAPAQAEGQMSEALKRKDAGKVFAAQNRRRVRGGGPAGSSRTVSEDTPSAGAGIAASDELEEL